MTELATAAHRAARRGLTRISHWIGGKRVAGDVGPDAARSTTPRSGEQTGAVDLATRRGGRRAPSRPRRRRSPPGARSRSRSAPS